MRRNSVLRTGVVAAVCALLAPGLRGAEPAEVKLGESFALRVGQRASVSEADLVVTFVAVLEDSRCPRGEQCIVAGKARVALEISLGGARPEPVELGTDEGFTEMDAGEFRVTLVALEPYPVSGRPIPPENYLATLAVSRR